LYITGAPDQWLHLSSILDSSKVDMKHFSYILASKNHFNKLEELD